MSHALATTTHQPAPLAAPQSFTRDQLDLLKRITADGKLSDDQFAVYIARARSSGLDPFSNQITAQARWNAREERHDLTIITGIDGFRLIAERTGARDGEDEPEWCGPDGVWCKLWTREEPPFAARVVVWRKDASRPYYGIATFRAYRPSRQLYDSDWWSKGADHMLAKCAEALALRKAFPAELAGLFTSDEMAQAGPPAAPPERAPRGGGERQAAARSAVDERVSKAERGRVGTLLGALKRSRAAADWWQRYEKEVLAMSAPARAELREAYKARRKTEKQAAAANIAARAAAAAADAPPAASSPGEVAEATGSPSDPGDPPQIPPEPPPGAGDAWEPPEPGEDYDPNTGEIVPPAAASSPEPGDDGAPAGL